MARTFNGSTQYGLVTASLGNLPLTLSCWVNPTSAAVNQTAIALCVNSGANPNYQRLQLLSSGLVQAGMSSISGTATVSSAGSYAANTWQHVCAVFTSSTSIAIFLNGVKTSATVSAITPSSINSASIATTFQGGIVTAFGGAIAEAAVWNVALSDNEVASLSKGFSPFRVRKLSLTAYWPLWGLASPEPDLAGSAHNLSLTASPTQSNHAPVKSFTKRQTTFTIQIPANYNATADLLGPSSLSALGSADYTDAATAFTGTAGISPLGAAIFGGSNSFQSFGVLAVDEVLALFSHGAISANGVVSRGGLAGLTGNGAVSGLGGLNYVGASSFQSAIGQVSASGERLFFIFTPASGQMNLFIKAPTTTPADGSLNLSMTASAPGVNAMFGGFPLFVKVASGGRTVGGGSPWADTMNLSVIGIDQGPRSNNMNLFVEGGTTPTNASLLMFLASPSGVDHPSLNLFCAAPGTLVGGQADSASMNLYINRPTDAYMPMFMQGPNASLNDSATLFVRGSIPVSSGLALSIPAVVGVSSTNVKLFVSGF